MGLAGGLLLSGETNAEAAAFNHPSSFDNQDLELLAQLNAEGRTIWQKLDKEERNSILLMAANKACKGPKGCPGLSRGCNGPKGCSGINADHKCGGPHGCGGLSKGCNGPKGCSGFKADQKCGGAHGCGGLVADKETPKSTLPPTQSPSNEYKDDKDDKNDGNLGYHLMTEEELLLELNDEGIKLYNKLSPEGKELARYVASQRCNGTNKCKGLNACQTEKNECAGKGSCEGLGKCAFSDKNLAVKVVSDKMAQKRNGALNKTPTPPNNKKH